MRQADHRPVDHQGGNHQCHQQAKGGFRRQIVDQHTQSRYQRGDQNGVHRYAALVDVHQRFRRVALLRQTEQHAAIAVYTAVIDRKGGGQHHDVQRIGNKGVAQLVENKDKRAGISGDARPRHQGKQNRQRTDIENQDAVDNLVSRFRNALLRVIGFCCGDADQFQPTKGEHDNRHHHHQTGEAVRQESPLAPQVADGGLWAAVAAKQQPAAEQDHGDYGDDFNNGKPELHLAKHLHVGQVDGVDQHEEGRRRNPGWDLRIPELNVFTYGS